MLQLFLHQPPHPAGPAEADLFRRKERVHSSIDIVSFLSLFVTGEFAMKFNRTVILSLVLAVLSAHTCDADETDKAGKTDEKHEATPEAQWSKHCRESISHYTVREREGDEKEFKRIPHAVMQHNNPANNNDRGLIYLWTQENGVPVVIISVMLQRYSKDTLKELHELHSFHDGPLHIQGENDRIVTMAVPGLKWHPVPDAPVPAENVTQQKLQSRSLARKFRGIMKHPQNGDVPLHVTPRPLHQYEVPDENAVRTGSLFAVCNAVDPEVLLMLEVRPDDAGKPQWCYACGGYTAWGTHMFYDDVEVWADDPAEFIVHTGYFVREGFKLPEEEAAVKP